jgi:sulfate permease, SulP family
MLTFNKNEWIGNLRGDILAGIVVALALVPEAIAFSIIAGVDPQVGLYASFTMAVTIAFVGGRPGMISAATGAMALLMVNLVKEFGIEYLFAASILAGAIQIFAGFIRLEKLMSFVSQSVVTGFVNALAILIFMAQLPELTNVSNSVYILTAVGLGIIYLFPLIPKIGKMIPSPLVCIIVLTAVTQFFRIDIRTVGDMGALPSTLPFFHIPSIPFNLDTFFIILPYSSALAVVGLLESLMTSTIVDELTDTYSDNNKEVKGQGIANIVVGFFGGMAGCAMIGQSIINVKSGGRGRLSALVAGSFLLVMVVFLSQWLKIIPMAALVAIMIMVSIGTFNWDSFKNLKQHPVSTNLVMLTTVFVVVFTHNLAYGVLAGVLLASLFFANKIGKFMYVEEDLSEEDSHRSYRVHGQVFFNSSNDFLRNFKFKENVNRVTIDLTGAHFWDISAVSAFDKAVIKFKKQGVDVFVIGLNEASQTIIDRFGVQNKPEETDRILAAH